jgi:hypothetical protein
MRNGMKGPYPMGTGAESLFHVDSGDVRLKTQPVKYTSNDGSVSCKLTVYTPSVSPEEVGYKEEGKIRDSPKEYFEIDAFEGKEKIMQTKKEQNIVDDFPIKCNTEGEALGILIKLLGE